VSAAATVILDVDGTLVDTNYHHTLAWYRALRSHGHAIQLWKVHRHIGMGGDQIVPALIGDEAAEREGDRIRAEEADRYRELIDEVEPMKGARDLLERLRTEPLTAVLASSAKEDEIDHYLDLLDARELVDAWTTSADVERTKPAADLVYAALEKAPEGAPALMVGDTVWDVRAAEAAGVPTLAVLTGGFSEAELREAGAVEVVQEIEALTDEVGKLASLARKPSSAGSGTAEAG
jgi:HAD superfamily hydrolase (TIGR01549 family)